MYSTVRVSLRCAQTSFCGSSLGRLKRSHFGARDYEHIGQALLDSLLDFSDPDPSKALLFTTHAIDLLYSYLLRVRVCIVVYTTCVRRLGRSRNADDTFEQK